MVPSFDLKKTVSFFTTLLNFEIDRDDDTYFILSKDNLTIHVQRAGSDIGEMSFYLVIDNIEKLWNQIKDKIEGIKVKEPFDQPYGMREIHIIVPETKTLLFIGQQIKN